jgi:predicted transcriptional regulator
MIICSMNTTAESVLAVIKDASRKHFHPDPELGIDSIALYMGISVDALMPYIEQLVKKGEILKSRIDKKSGTKHAPAGNVRLCV